MQWYIYGLLGSFILASMMLIFKWLSTKGVPNALILFFIFLFGAAFYLIHLFFNKTSIQLPSKWIFILLLTAFLSYVGNLFYLRASNTAPNAGYAAAINGLQIVVITVGAFFLFQGKISFLNGVGIVLAIISIFLLTL